MDTVQKLDLDEDSILNQISSEEAERDASVARLLERGVVGHLAHLLTTSPQPGHTAKVIAELAKTEDARSPCISLVPLLLKLINTDEEHMLNATQACRALGNICFDNDTARTAIFEQSGVPTVVALMRRALRLSTEGAPQLRTVVCGLLLNLTNTHETLQEAAVGAGAMAVLADYLTLHATHEATVQMALLCVGSLADSEPGKVRLAESGVLLTIVQLLTTAHSLRDTTLELLASLAEQDTVKLSLAKSDLPQHLVTLVQESEPTDSGDNNDQPNTQKMAADLLVLLLTGDAAMEELYSAGEGLVYTEALHWLDGTNNHLKMSAALAIGNFARKDAHCVRLVAGGVPRSLLGLLEEAGTDTAPTLQHAVFSALRNLAIPEVNKPLMLASGLIPALLPHAASQFSSVQFTLLGTLRLAIDKQEEGARQLGTNTEFVQRLITWCSIEEHAGVKGEACRLVAWLVKHAGSSEVMRVVCAHGGVPPLVTMATSEHTVMQTEALLALSLMASAVLDVCVPAFTDTDLVATVKVLLTDTSTAPEVCCNTLTLARLLAPSAALLEQMRVADLHTVIQDLNNNPSPIVAQAAREASHKVTG